MARQRREQPAPPPTSVAVQPPPVSPEVAHGLEAIRLHGGRDEELYLSAPTSFFQEAFMTDRIVTAEESTRFIKKIEALVRSSREYSRYIAYMRTDLGMNRCSFLSNLDMSSDEISLEFHHCPINLYQIVDIIITHRLARGQAVTSLSVADEVMRAHYDNTIGLVPLSRSVHKLVHSGALVVHPAMVHGNWLEFLRAYPDGVNEELIASLLAFVNVTEDDVSAATQKIDASQTAPRLRDDSFVPSREELNLLLLAPPGA